MDERLKLISRVPFWEPPNKILQANQLWAGQLVGDLHRWSGEDNALRRVVDHPHDGKDSPISSDRSILIGERVGPSPRLCSVKDSCAIEELGVSSNPEILFFLTDFVTSRLICRKRYGI